MNELHYEILNELCNKIGPRFKFGYNSSQDMIQIAWELALDGYSRYDGKRNLRAYISAHLHNRLCNYKRDHYHRPCKSGCRDKDGELCARCQQNSVRCKLAFLKSIDDVENNFIEPSQKIILDEYLEEAKQRLCSKDFENLVLYINGDKLSNKKFSDLQAKLKEIFLCD